MLLTFAVVKLICLILSVYVLLLSARSCCADKECQQQISQQKRKTEKAASEEKECPGCSPFFSCGSCLGFIVVSRLTTTLPAPSEMPVETFKPYPKCFYKQITLSVWQPPKLS
jgi:hypothetical protein